MADRPVAYKGSNERLSRNYRSPPLSSRVSGSSSNRYSNNNSYDEHRSRRDEEPHSSCLSKFYRERFGSHSPEDYLNLRMSQFDKDLSKDNIRSILEKEFKALTPFEIKIVQNPDSDGRLAYINFERPECAKIVRRNMVPRLQKVLGRRIVLDPTGVIRDQEGKYIPDRYNRAAMAAAADRGRSPPSRVSSSRRRASPPSNENSSSSFLNGTARRREGAFGNLNQDDKQASRTIFVGNLPGDVRETELKRIFEIFGNIDNIDIKTLQDSNAAFAFILYQTVEEAIEARGCQHNRPIRPGSTRCQIGYGKSQQSYRLYIGGLGSWTSYDLLMNEFERFGAVDYLEYEPGQKFAYIRFETMDAAIEACGRMKHFDLSSKGNHITIDFAKDIRRRKRGRSDSEDDYDAKRHHGPRTPSLSPTRSPTEAGYIETLEDFRDQIASTWKGIVTLKKAEYPLSLHRIFGKEHMVQDWLRDEQGNALRLSIIQRLPLDVEYYKRTIELTKNELALMIAVEGSQPVEPLVTYLKEKYAAGVVSIQNGNASVHIMPYSQIAERLIKFFAPRVAILKPDCNYLLIALKKNILAAQTSQSSSPTPSVKSTQPPEPTRLPPPPPLPFLVKREVEEASHIPLREDRPAFQMQLKIRQENADIISSPSRTISVAPPPPPIPPELSPPGNGKSSRKEADDEVDSSESSSEGENDHRRPPTQQHYQMNQRRYRKDNDDYENEEDGEEEQSSENDEDDDDDSGSEKQRISSRSNGGNVVKRDNKTDDEEEGRVSSDSEESDE